MLFLPSEGRNLTVQDLDRPPLGHKSPHGGLTAAPEQASLFQRVADWTSAAMGRPTNIMIWLVAVIAWTLTFALGGSHISSGDWLPRGLPRKVSTFP